MTSFTRRATPTKLRLRLALGALVIALLVLNATALAGNATPSALQSALKSAPQSPSQSPPPAVAVVAAATRVIRDRVTATGAINAVEEISVSPLLDGLSIRSAFAERGDRVVKGAPLALLNADALLLEKNQIAAALAKAEAMLAQSQAQLVEAKGSAEEATRVAQRAEQLLAHKILSTAEGERLRALAVAARARLRAAEQSLPIAAADIKLVQAQMDDVQLRLARTIVTAPVDGVISAKSAKVGAIATGDAPLYAIILDGALEMKADVAEADLVKLAVGLPATIALADGRTLLQGKIRLIAPTVDPRSRLGAVHIALSDAAAARAGMSARAVIIAEERWALVLPRSAVGLAQNRAIVRKVEDGVVRVTPVVLGIQDGPLVEILSGLAVGDLVVAKAGAFVRDGDRIQPVAATAPIYAQQDARP